jgi:hypothetical protein
VAAYASDILPLYATSVAFEDSLWAERFGAMQPENFEPFVGQLREYFRSLPPDQFPNLSSMADALTRVEGDERFEFGLDLLVRGLQSLAR